MPDVGGIAGARLKSFIERIERVEEEINALNGDKKEIYAEARGTGFDVKIMKKLIAIRRSDQDTLDEEETLLDVYKRALGMIPDFPSHEREEPVRAGAPARVPSVSLSVKGSAEIVGDLAEVANDALAVSRAIPRGDAAFASELREVIRDAGFVETSPGQFKAPATESAEPF